MAEDAADQTTGAPAGAGGEAEDPLAKLQAAYAAEHGKGETAGKRALLRELGFSTKEEALGWVAAQRAASSDASEIQKQLQEATAARVAAEAQVHELGLSFEASRALIESGVRPDRVEASLRLVMDDLRRHPEAPTSEVVKATVATFKVGLPEMFSQPAAPPGTDPTLKPSVPGTSGLNGGTAPAGAGMGSDPAALGDAEFERRHRPVDRIART